MLSFSCCASYSHLHFPHLCNSLFSVVQRSNLSHPPTPGGRTHSTEEGTHQQGKSDLEWEVEAAQHLCPSSPGSKMDSWGKFGPEFSPPICVSAQVDAACSVSVQVCLTADWSPHRQKRGQREQNCLKHQNLAVRQTAGS